jgi:hypothetical protein
MLYFQRINTLYVQYIRIQYTYIYSVQTYEGGPKSNRNLNVARKLEVDARCAARCCDSTQYSSSLPRGVSLG